MRRIAFGLAWLLLLVSFAPSQSPAAREQYDAGVALRAKKDQPGGGVGMDVDLGFDAPTQYLGKGAKRAPNPEYQYWLDGLRKKE